MKQQLVLVLFIVAILAAVGALMTQLAAVMLDSDGLFVHLSG
jgi:hypothetical protein